MKTVAVVVLNWKTPSLTIDTVNSLLKITHPGFKYHIYLVDNGSPDDSYKIFLKKFSGHKDISTFNTGQNLGYVDGNNFGIKKALRKKFDYVMVINNDVLVKKDFLTILFDFLENNPDYGLVGPKIYFAPGHEFHRQRYSPQDLGKVIWSVGGTIDWRNIYGSNLAIDEVDHGQFTKLNSGIDYLSGCCLLIRSAVFDKIGLFDSRYFMYMEDADFSHKAKSAGYKIACLPDSVIWHINSGSSDRGSIHDYFLTRNRLLFGFGYASLRTKLALFRDSLRILFTSPQIWQRYGVRDYYLGKFGKGSYK